MSKSGIVAYYIYNKREKNIISILNKQEKREKLNKASIDPEGNFIIKSKKEIIDEVVDFIDNEQEEKEAVELERKVKKNLAPDTVFELLNRE